MTCRIVLVAAVLFALHGQAVQGAEWGFFIAPYGWLASINGKVVTNGRETDEGDNRNGTDFLQHGPMIGAGFNL